MQRDSLFYRIFQQAPTLIFDLLQERPADAEAYRFDSVEIKQTSFRIDGVFLPPDASGITYFVEVQCQTDEMLYERMLSESSLYFYRNRDRCRDYQMVAIYPSASLEQSDLEPHRFLIDTGKLTRIYLDELGAVEELPIGLGLMLLTIFDDDEAKAVAQQLVNRAQRETEDRAIIDMVSTVLLYRFTNLTRDEVNAMFVDSSIQESRAYQEIKAEGMAEVVLRQLGRCLDTEIPDTVRQQIEQLSIDQLNQLAEDLLDFTAIEDLTSWLAQIDV